MLLSVVNYMLCSICNWHLLYGPDITKTLDLIENGDKVTTAPVLKLTTMSMRKMVSETQLNTTQRIERSSLKKEMATGKMIKLAISSSSMQMSQ